MTHKKIAYEEIDEIYRFIKKSVIHYRQLGQRPENLLITMPWWLKHLFINYRRSEFGIGIESPRDLENQRFFNVDTQSHFKDEVVVFIENTYTWGDLEQPLIHIIKFEVFDIVKK